MWGNVKWNELRKIDEALWIVRVEFNELILRDAAAADAAASPKLPTFKLSHA